MLVPVGEPEPVPVPVPVPAPVPVPVPVPVPAPVEQVEEGSTRHTSCDIGDLEMVMVIVIAMLYASACMDEGEARVW